MITQEDAKMERKLRHLEVARVLIGVTVIVAVVAVVLSGIDAFTKERDAGLAMRLPLSIAVLLIWSFGRSAKAIVTLEARVTDENDRSSRLWQRAGTGRDSHGPFDLTHPN